MFKKRWDIIRLVIMMVILGVVLWLKFAHHEMWKDEWQAWFVSRDKGLIDMLGFLYYEGHPALWYLWLKPFTFLFSDGVLGLKLAHAIPLMATFFLLWRLEVNEWYKWLFALSYATAFEYGVVSRGYVLVILLGLWMLWLIRNHKDHGTLFYILLFLLCQTEVQGVILASAFLMMKAWSLRHKLPSLWPMASTVLAGIAVFVVTVYPRQDTDELANAYSDGLGSLMHWALTFQGTTVNAIWPGVLPDTNVFGSSTLGILIGLGLLAAIGFIFRQHTRILVFFGAFWLATWVFHILLYGGGLRQWSMVSVALGFSFLMLKTDTKWLKGAALILFLPSCFYAGKAFVKDYKLPFTNAKATAAFLDKKVPENVPVVGINKFECTPIVGYADQPVYALPDGETFTYFKWVEKIYMPSEQELKLFAQYKGVGGLVVLAPFELDKARYPNLREWKRFDRFNLKNESYILYLLDR